MTPRLWIITSGITQIADRWWRFKIYQADEGFFTVGYASGQKPHITDLHPTREVALEQLKVEVAQLMGG